MVSFFVVLEEFSEFVFYIVSCLLDVGNLGIKHCNVSQVSKQFVVDCLIGFNGLLLYIFNPDFQMVLAAITPFARALLQTASFFHLYQRINHRLFLFEFFFAVHFVIVIDLHMHQKLMIDLDPLVQGAQHDLVRFTVQVKELRWPLVLDDLHVD